ncbi:MAG: MFS transporter [Cellulomonas sp. 73-145]|uniref:nitrate/nitrite transporter n=1 Tax=Cellulomonas sp. 73-145 TaxID=1895739 RepID=UPI0009289E0D|nr:nitrate/nitrite transporter [Cellulomonas sp. 73-145]MBN9328397.1 NarK/NasA family nitrate transporter [Cellulomonas sp.]OJV60549.1 MAG: MFS transporter [Cellulomonas sp. 73-145]
MAQLATSGRVLEGWNPEDEKHWDSKIAWRTLAVTTYSLLIAFCVWYLVSAVAPKLNEVGFTLTKPQLYWLVAIPGLSGGLIRLVYMFLPPVLGTRKLVGITSLLLVVPMLGWFSAVGNPKTPYWWLLVLAALTGIGGGCFSGYMPSTGYFFPKRLAGTALGLQAGLGNFGVSLIQFLGPWVMGFGLFGLQMVGTQHARSGHVLNVYNAAIVLVPWTVLASILAFWLLKDVPIKANFRQQIDIFGNRNTWVLTAVYIMTFGAFSGFAAQLALIINNTFGKDSPFATGGHYATSTLPLGGTFAFLAPLIGSLVRAMWGPLCDRFGGAIWTFVGGVGMVISAAVAAVYLSPRSPHDFWPFLFAMLVMFFFTGIANAGTFKQMPMILPPRQAGGVIGWTAAIASFGPFFVGVSLTAVTPKSFFIGATVYFAICTVLVWVNYARPRAPYPG